MSIDFFRALRTLVMGSTSIFAGSLTGLNTMSGNEYS